MGNHEIGKISGSRKKMGTELPVTSYGRKRTVTV